MAIYSNFDGTLKDSIQVGKKGPKIAKDGQNIKVVQNDDVTLATLEVGSPTNSTHAAPKSYTDAKFGTTPTTTRTNAESDAIYQALSSKNTANGYVGLDSSGKIESQFMPSISVTDVITVHNVESRNTNTTLNQGDIALILSIPLWVANASIAAGTIIRVPDVASPIGNYFYVANSAFTNGTTSFSDDQTNNPTRWGTSTWLTGSQTYTIGQEVLHNRELFISLVAETHSNATSDITKFRKDDYADSGLYILTRAPTGPSSTSLNADWASVDFGAQVQTFNGRTGTVTPQTNDYRSDQITFTPSTSITATTSQAAIQQVSDNSVKKTGDTLTGPLRLSSATALAPAISVSGNNRTGIYNSIDNALAVSFNGEEKMRFGADVTVNANLAMNNKRITNLVDPVSSSDASTKSYVDSKPAISKSTFNPLTATGKDSDVHFRAKTGGNISTPISAKWNSITSDGSKYIVLSNEMTNPIAASSDDRGETWARVDMPGAPTDASRYNYTVTNGPGHYLAVRNVINPLNSDSQLVYTVDGGANWTSVNSTNFSWSGEFVASNSTVGTNYVLVDANGDGAYYSRDNGNSWTRTSLPSSANWVSSAGKGNTFVVIDSTNKSSRSIDGGQTWTTGGNLPQTIMWNSVATSNGTNFVAVGQASAGSTSIVSAYSDDGGMSWQQSSMPTSAYWIDLESNGSSYVAVRLNSDQGARTIDGGKTWQTIQLPRTGSWGRVASNSQGYAIVDSGPNTANPIAISTDGGTTWTNTITGGIDNIFIKNGTGWLAYKGITTAEGDARYIAKIGDKMTGRLVIDTGTNSQSIQTTGSITAGTAVESFKQLLNDTTIKEGGRIEIGAVNQDSVTTGNAYRWQITTSGSNAGYGLRLQSVHRGGTSKIRLDCRANDTVLYSPVGINASSMGSTLHVDQLAGNLNTALSVYGKDGRSVVELFSKTNTADFMRFYSSVSSVDYTTSSLSLSSTPVCSISALGSFSTRTNMTAGVGSISTTAKFNAYPTTAQTGYLVDTTLIPTNAIDVVGLKISSRISNELSDSHIHVSITEGADEALRIDKSGTKFGKRVAIGASVSTNATLFVNGTDSMRIPTGNTAQRPITPSEGMIRRNNEIKEIEIYDGTKWESVHTGITTATYTKAKSEWVLTTGTVYKITIPALTHGLGAEIFAQFQEKIVSGNYRNTNFDYEVSPLGEFTVFADVDSTTDLPDVRIFLHV